MGIVLVLELPTDINVALGSRQLRGQMALPVACVPRHWSDTILRPPSTALVIRASEQDFEVGGFQRHLVVAEDFEDSAFSRVVVIDFGDSAFNFLALGEFTFRGLARGDFVLAKFFDVLSRDARFRIPLDHRMVFAAFDILFMNGGVRCDQAGEEYREKDFPAISHGRYIS